MLLGGGDMVMAWKREEEEEEEEEEDAGGKDVSESPSQPQSATEGTGMCDIHSIIFALIVFSSRI